MLVEKTYLISTTHLLFTGYSCYDQSRMSCQTGTHYTLCHRAPERWLCTLVLQNRHVLATSSSSCPFFNPSQGGGEVHTPPSGLHDACNIIVVSALERPILDVLCNGECRILSLYRNAGMHVREETYSHDRMDMKYKNDTLSY